MPDLFKLPFQKDQCVRAFDPMSWCYALGDECTGCSRKIIFNQSITLCHCHRYAHEKCLLALLEKDNTLDQEITYSCMKCQQNINVIYDLQVKFGPVCRTRNVLGSLFFFLLTIFFIIEGFKVSPDNYLMQGLICSGLTVFSSMFLLAVGNILFKRVYRPLRVRSTNLDLIISAFINLEKLEEQTQTEMIRQQ